MVKTVCIVYVRVEITCLVGSATTSDWGTNGVVLAARRIVDECDPAANTTSTRPNQLEHLKSDTGIDLLLAWVWHNARMTHLYQVLSLTADCRSRYPD